MSATRRNNLHRLLKPRHVAVIGGNDAAKVINECRRIGFTGEIWPVNPTRKSLADIPCYATIDELPTPPDAVFLAIPAEPALEVVAQLARAGAGGVVAYTAGFGGDGKEGGSSDQALVDAAGNLALVGPNCYGVINYLDKVALWPFEHGGFSPGYGAAIVTQSGMLSSDITMNQRSVPLSYMISAGNQSVLTLEDYVDVLCERDEVRAIGLHIEGLKDISAFSSAALKAQNLNKPIVALKTGTSKLGSQLTISHTGSLSGSRELYQALFDRLGIISVDSPAQLLETLKFLCISGVPNGNRLTGFTCSGGGATLVADQAERLGLSMPEFSDTTSSTLTDLLPAIATVSNPLDYTTPIWGLPEKTQPVFEAALQDECDVTLLVQDYPLVGIDASKRYYTNDAQSFVAANASGIPAAVCCTLPENMDIDTREFLVSQGVTPLQGIVEALHAVKGACWYGVRSAEIKQHRPELPMLVDNDLPLEQQNEWFGKSLLAERKIAVPLGKPAQAAQLEQAAQEIGFPVVLKAHSSNIAHKSDLGAVVLNIQDKHALVQALTSIKCSALKSESALDISEFLIEKMAADPLLELMVSIRVDAQFGRVMTLSYGGVLIELFDDAVTLILPASLSDLRNALHSLRVAPLLRGYRGAEPVDMTMLCNALSALAEVACDDQLRIAELEINPLFVYTDSVLVVDVLMHTYGIQ